MTGASFFARVLAPILSAIRVTIGWFSKKASFADGFHVRRDGRVIYHGSNGPLRFQRKGWGWRAFNKGYYRGCPKMTGLRLLRTTSNMTGIPLKEIKRCPPSVLSLSSSAICARWSSEPW